MKILKGAITSLASEGDMTLQIPQYDIWIDGKSLETLAKLLKEPPSDEERFEEIPDEWVMTLTNGQRPVIGKEKGFLFLSKDGWNANWKEIRKAFLNSGDPRGTWADFENHVEMHFRQVTEATKKKIMYEQKRLKELRRVLKKL